MRAGIDRTRTPDTAKIITHFVSNIKQWLRHNDEFFDYKTPLRAFSWNLGWLCWRALKRRLWGSRLFIAKFWPADVFPRARARNLKRRMEAGKYYSNTAITQVRKSLKLEQTVANSPPALLRPVYAEYSPWFRNTGRAFRVIYVVKSWLEAWRLISPQHALYSPSYLYDLQLSIHLGPN